MPTEASALPASLTVWAGPSRYVFAPGRDVVVGYGPGCDIPLERLAPQPPPAPRVDVVLRFTGAHWVAIDLSHRGIFLDGSRVPTVEIRDGLAITIEDPRHGPRLVFQVADPGHSAPRPPCGAGCSATPPWRRRWRAGARRPEAGGRTWREGRHVVELTGDERVGRCRPRLRRFRPR